MRPGFSAVTPEVAVICSLLMIGLSFLVFGMRGGCSS